MKFKVISNLLFWIVLVLFVLFGLGAINVFGGFKPIDEATLVTGGTLLLINFIIRSMIGWKTEAEEKQNNVRYKNWLKRIRKLLDLISLKLTFLQKKDFCKEATKREIEQKTNNILTNNKIDEWFYENAFKNKKTIKEWLSKQVDLTAKQKRILKKLILKGVSFKPYSVAQLNTLGDKNNSTIYTVKNPLSNIKRRDAFIWVVSSGCTFLAFASLVLRADQNILMALSQSALMLVSILYNIVYSTLQHKKYVNVVLIEFLKEISNFYIDACKFSKLDTDLNLILTTKISEIEEEEQASEDKAVENEKAV